MNKDLNEIAGQPLDVRRGQQLLAAKYPKGLHSIIEERKEPAGTSATQDVKPIVDAILEVEVERLSTIIVDKEPFVFLHNLKKAASLRMDDCLSMICITGKFPFDTQSTHLDTMLLPLGDSVLGTLKFINEELELATQEDVPKDNFQATQAELVAQQTPLP